MDVFFKFLISAMAGGVVGGFGNAVLGEGLSGITRDSTTQKLDLGSWKNILVGLLSGVAWLAPNADRWTRDTNPSYSALGMIAIQTLVIGLAGSAWLTSYVNGNRLKGAIADVAGKSADPQIASQIAGAKSTREIMSLVEKIRP